MRLIVLVFLFFSTFLQAEAQSDQMLFYNLTTKNGLSESTGQFISQDFEGYIWIGTLDGLNKYDGSTFKVYKSHKNNQLTLWDNKLSCILEDSKRNLWIGTITGLNKYNRNLDVFERIMYPNEKGEIFRDRILALHEDTDGNIWIGTNSGVYIIDTINNVFSKQLNEYCQENNVNYCQSITGDHEGNIWFGFNDENNGGLLKYNPETGNKIAYHMDDSIHRISSNKISCLMADHLNNLWVGTSDNGIDVINHSTGDLKHYETNPSDNNSISNNLIHSITQDNEGTIYIGTDNGLSIFDSKSNSFNRHYASQSENSLLTNIIFGSSFCGADNSMWFSCKGAGISIYDKRFNKFKHYQNEHGNENSLSNSNITGITEDANGKIWIAIDGGGVNYFDPVTDQFKRFKHDPTNPRWLTNDKVLAVMADSKNGLWVGMWNGGLCYFKIENDTLIFKKKYEHLSKDFPLSNSVFVIHKTKNDDLWIGTYSTGPFKYNPSTDEFIHYAFKTENSTQNEFQSIMNIYFDTDDNMWLATIDDGLIFYNTKTHNYINYSHIESDSTSLPSQAINVVLEDKMNRLWIGTGGSGLSLFNKTNKQFKTFTTNDGLPSDMIQGILEDDNGHLWISTTKGISKMHIKDSSGILTADFRNYNSFDGLQDNHFNPWSFYKSRNGNMFFGGINGLNVFDPNEINDNPIAPPVHITELLMFNNPITISSDDSPLMKHISQTKELTFSHKQNMLTFKFSALNFIHNSENEYAYRMENLENNWNYVGNQQLATYTNIAPGNYTFKVIASNNDGVWNSEGTSIKITILPAWWQTWWFKTILVLLIIVTLYAIYYLRVKELNKQKKILERKVKIRTSELQTVNATLRNKQVEIQEQNEELVSNEEELQQTNEELSAINDQLHLQKKQLEDTINNLKETQQQLVESEKMATVGILTSGIAHEINNPLNFIMGGKTGIEVLMNKELVEHSKTVAPYMKMINEGITRAITIIQGLNRFNRQSEKYDENCNINVIIDNCLLMLQNNIKFIVEVSKSYTDSPSKVIGNEGELHQVFINILSNAVHAIGNNGKITISTSVENDNLIVQITDTGYGISKENLSKITTPFFTTKSPGEGTGLGMSISYSILKKHSASINYESEEGSGTEVTVCFPNIR